MKKRRLLRIAGFVLALLLFVSYFAFQTFLFPPLEGDYEPDVATLIPRDVDLYCAKADLARDFSAFPSLAVLDRLEESKQGRAFLELVAPADSERTEAIRVGVEGLEQVLAGLPIEIDPIEVAGGRDAAVAGYLEPGGRTSWVTYARISFLGKLGVALLPYLDLSAQGLSVTSEQDILTLSGGELPEPLHLLRIRDVLIAGTSRELVARAPELESARGQDSLFLSARYDPVRKAQDREGDELELYVGVPELLANQGVSGAWPAAEGESLFGPLLSRFFQLNSLTEVSGVVGFGGGPRVQLTADVSTEALDTIRKRLYRKKGFECAKPGADEPTRSGRSAQELSEIAPADTYLFLLAHADVADTLRAVRASLARDEQSLMDDVVRQVWGYADALPLIDEIAGALEDRFMLIVRKNDYVEPLTEDAPQGDGQPVFAWALVFWMESQPKIEELRQKVIDNQSAFGIRGSGQNLRGVFTNIVQGGYKVYEYHQPFIPGTGHLSSVTEAPYFVLSNSHLMLGQLLQTYRQGGPDYPRLSDQGNFHALVRHGLDEANVLAWWNPRAASELSRRIAENLARNEIFVDWDRERPRIQSLIAEEHYPEHRAEIERGQIPAEIEQDFLALYNREATLFEERFVEEWLPVQYAEREQQILASELFTGLLIEAAFDPKRWTLYAKGLVPFED